MAKDIMRVTVVGGGSAGLVAAIAAARKGASVTIYEKNNRVGKKLLATGNGRCNLTNTDPSLSYYHGKQSRFALGALKRFGYEATIEFFRHLGIEPWIGEGGKVYPASLQASSVLDVLRYELEQLQVNIRCDTSVIGIRKRGSGFALHLSSGQEAEADKVILATGGKAAPNLGSNGDGYRLAATFGHKLIEPFPALVQLKLDSPHIKRLAGLRFDAKVDVRTKTRVFREEQGEVLFTNYGISGPSILQLSRKANELLNQGEPVAVQLNVVPWLTPAELDSVLLQRFCAQPTKQLAFNLVGFIHKQLAPVLILEADLDGTQQAGRVTDKERQRLARLMQEWSLRVTGSMPWASAQVTAGGIDVSQVHQDTLESKLAPGLYLVGELLDIDGDCGGYNLQWAWSSGILAGEHAASATNSSKEQIQK